MSRLNFFRKTELVISHPHKFFEQVKSEKSVWRVFEYYFIFVFLSIFINIIFNMPEVIKQQAGLSAPMYLLFIVVSIAFVLLVVFAAALASFFLYWLYHILIKIFRGKEKYPATYKLLYAATPLLIVFLIPYFGIFKLLFIPLFFIALIDAFYIEYVGLVKLHRMSRHNALAVIIITFIIGALLIYILAESGLAAL